MLRQLGLDDMVDHRFLILVFDLSAAFLDAYRDAMTEKTLWPNDSDEAKALLDFFLLEKAFYEIEYELSNRPGWVAIPLEATIRILQQRGVIA